MERLEMLKQLLSQGVTSDLCLFCRGEIDPSIVRGSTKEHTFEVQFTKDSVKDLKISYIQNNKLIIEKKLTDIKFSGNLIICDLTETETYKLITDKPVLIQLKALLKRNNIITSRIFSVDVLDPIDDRFFLNESLTYALEASTNNQNIDLKDYFGAVSCSNGIYKCKFLFDSTWNKYFKKAIFKDEYNHKIYSSISQNGDKFECIIPNLLLNKPGRLYVGVTGFYHDGTTEYRKPTIWSNSIRIKKGCVEDTQIYDTTSFNDGGLFIYCGVSDDARAISLPSEMEILPSTRKELLNGYTWSGYTLANQYNVIAIPKFLNIECIKMVQNDYDVIPTYHTSSDNNYTFYYFSSKATGTFASTYYFKEVS